FAAGPSSLSWRAACQASVSLSSCSRAISLRTCSFVPSSGCAVTARTSSIHIMSSSPSPSAGAELADGRQRLIGAFVTLFIELFRLGQPPAQVGDARPGVGVRRHELGLPPAAADLVHA